MQHRGFVNGVPVIGSRCGNGTGDEILVTADGASWIRLNSNFRDPNEFGTGIIVGRYTHERSEPDER